MPQDRYGPRRYEYGRTQGKKGITWRIVVNSYPCPECHVSDGRACLTVSNRPKAEPHASRSARAALRGWAFADMPARCLRCHGKLPPDTEAPARCARCVLREEGPKPTRATRDKPGPDGSYDVPLFGEESEE